MEDVHLKVAEPAPASNTRRILVQVATRPQLADPLPLARALRPLRCQVASAGREVFDEDATADRGAEQRLWLPVLTPAKEPTYDLALVIDTSESMTLWHALTREFRSLCEQLGAFRDIRIWHLTTSDSKGHPVLRGASPVSGARDPRELLDPTGRRLVVVVTDGVHPWWQPSGPLQPILTDWAQVNPVAIIQPFPQRLWNRSMLRPAVVEFRANGRGRSTALTLLPPQGMPVSAPVGPEGDSPPNVLPEMVTIPILELTPTALHRWARLTVGSGEPATLAAAILPRKPGPARDAIRRGSPADLDPEKAAQLVRDFRGSVSPAAYRLAGYLSSASPLTLPVMRLVQQSMLPESGPAELAEVFLSGLLRRLSTNTRDGNGDTATYVFAAHVRDVLFSTITRAEAATVQERVGSYLVSGQRVGRSFPAVLERLSDEDMRTAAERYPSSFGRIRRMLLERIGGPYAKAALDVQPVKRAETDDWPTDWVPLSGSRFFQPMLFVGLGGTGCAVGAEFERRLRAAICGPDGNDFRRRRSASEMLPYQLPSCMQFVYADMDVAELDRMPQRVVPGAEHAPSVALTAQYVHISPRPVSYPELARDLRLQADHVTDWWLPPAKGEPQVNSLHHGAQQFPTIGRAALFGTLLDGIAPGLREIRTAIGKLANSGEDLWALGGELPKALDVFVAFSVAGGTGCGTFYDYLHLLAEALRDIRLRVKIFPLVLMPSASGPDSGDGRTAELNAGRALFDLFSLVDQQNATHERGLVGREVEVPVGPEEVAVRYPGGQQIVLPPGIVQTAFLFSQPVGWTRHDMHRSLVSFMLSMVGTELTEEDDRSEISYRSFAETFVNKTAHRYVAAENGIGSRGVSTALAASLTVPVDELAGIVGSRLLRTAVEQMSAPTAEDESSSGDVERFLTAAGVQQLLLRQAGSIVEPAPAHGARGVVAALNARQEAMADGLATLEAQLARDVPQLAVMFNPSRAVNDLLGAMDVFRVQRAVSAAHQGLLVPAAPDGYGSAPPPVPELRDRLFGQVRWTDSALVTLRSQQDAWYRWATDAAWAEAWDASRSAWGPPLERVQKELNALTSRLKNFAFRNHEEFEQRSANLYRRRDAVSYLLPRGQDPMGQFYEEVVQRMTQSHVRAGRLPRAAETAQLVQTILDAGGWHEAYGLSVDRGPDLAVTYLQELLRSSVKSFLREPGPGEQPLLPDLKNVLAEAAGHGVASSEMQDYLEEFNGKLAKLIPRDVTPQGGGPLKVLVRYPSTTPNDVIAQYLSTSINLPHGPGVTLDFRNTLSESVSVVMFRTAMSITDVPEVRDTLRLWADAVENPQQGDLLRWRQRTGYDFGYLTTREVDRVGILHRLLCALWNGKADTEGPEESPRRVVFRFSSDSQSSLPLSGFGQASSWGSLLHGWERWALDDDDIHRRFCAELMYTLPASLRTMSGPPHRLYTVVRNLADGQTNLLEAMLRQNAQENSRSQAAQMKAFWEKTIPAALDMEFSSTEPLGPRNLRELEAEVASGD